MILLGMPLVDKVRTADMVGILKKAIIITIIMVIPKFPRPHKLYQAPRIPWGCAYCEDREDWAACHS